MNFLKIEWNSFSLSGIHIELRRFHKTDGEKFLYFMQSTVLKSSSIVLTLHVSRKELSRQNLRLFKILEVAFDLMAMICHLDDSTYSE